MRILYGTTNRAKLGVMKPVADSLGFELIGLNDVHRPLPDIDESGNSPLDNACIKARAYFDAFSLPVFSCDSGLYFDGVDEALQPGTHVRRVGGKELSDDEMTEYYAGLAKKYGGRLVARYRNAICFIADAETRFTCMDDSLTSEPFVICDKPHKKRVKGFPLDPLSVDINSGKYYYDMNEEYDRITVVNGLHKFFEKALAQIRGSRD